MTTTANPPVEKPGPDASQPDGGFTDFVREYTRPARILIVEDDGSIATVLSTMLKQFGTEPKVCVNGHDAVTAMALEQFDLVISDLKLPDISYPNLCRHIEQKQPLAPVVIISGYIDERAMTTINALLDRPVWYIEKPICFNPERMARLFATLKIRAPYKGKGLLWPGCLRYKTGCVAN